jgi:hypothetical protein
MHFARLFARLPLAVAWLPFAAALLILAPIASLAADRKRAAVLEFELAPGVKSIDRIYLSDRARTALHDAAPGLFVMTRESTEALLQANGKTMADCTGECEVEVGRKLGADYIISGRITQFGSRTSVTMRLFATSDGQLLSSAEATGKSADALFDGMAAALIKLLEPLATTPALDSPASNASPAPSGSPSQPRATSAGAGTIKVVSSPSGAKVSVDGDAAGSTPLTIKKDAGTYVVTVELPGYAPASRQVDVASGKTVLVNESLMQAAGYLEIGVSPEEAARAGNVTVDGQPAGVGKQGPYKVGKHAVRVEASGYKPAEQTVGVDNGGTASVSLVLEALPGKLLLSVNVAAQCSAGGARVEATPDGMVKLEVLAGAARVTCSAEGHEDASADVTVGPGRAQAVKLTLKRGASGAAGVDATSGVTLISLSGGTLQLDGGNFNGTRVAPFKLARTATTVAQYKKCVEAGGCSAPKTDTNCNWGTGRNDHPVNCVDWNQATAFCKWMGARLPMAEEREWAASSGEGRAYPWGNEPQGAKACWDGEGSDVGKGNRKTTCAAGSHPAGASKQGVEDLAGNVWEWLSNDYTGGKEVRGGSWDGGYAEPLRASFRSGGAPSNAFSYIGFRCGL